MVAIAEHDPHQIGTLAEPLQGAETQQKVHQEEEDKYEE